MLLSCPKRSSLPVAAVILNNVRCCVGINKGFEPGYPGHTVGVSIFGEAEQRGVREYKQVLYEAKYYSNYYKRLQEWKLNHITTCVYCGLLYFYKKLFQKQKQAMQWRHQ